MERFEIDVDGLSYSLDELPTRSASKTVFSVSLTDAEPDSGSASANPRLVDRVDLFSFGSRRRFAQLVAGHFGREPDAVLGQLAIVLDAVCRARVQAESPDPVELTPERKRRAAALLRRKDLLDQAADAMDALGFVGEAATKRLAGWW